jgi:hypothetical protein
MNRWLERIEEDDNGPVASADNELNQVAESRPEYFVLSDEMPF